MQKKIILVTTYLVMAGIIVSLTVAAYMRNSVFKTPVTLWADASSESKSANKRRTHENYGQALSTAGAASKNWNDAFELYSEALHQFQTVLALKDDGSVPPRDVYREIGVVDLRMGLVDASIAAWQKGLQYAPGDPSLLNNLSVAFMQQKRYDDAESAVRQALYADPNMPYLLNTMGEILMQKGNYQEALKYFLASIENGPDVAARYWNATLAFEKTGRYDMAYNYASLFAERAPTREMREQALAYMNRLQSLYPSKLKKQ